VASGGFSFWSTPGDLSGNLSEGLGGFCQRNVPIATNTPRKLPRFLGIYSPCNLVSLYVKLSSPAIERSDEIAPDFGSFLRFISVVRFGQEATTLNSQVVVVAQLFA